MRHVSDHDEIVRLRSDFNGLVAKQAVDHATGKAAHDRIDALVHPSPVHPPSVRDGR